MTNSETKNFSQNVSSSYHLEDRGKCNKNACANARNVPKLRFKGYNYEWKKVKLKDICIDFIVPMRDKPKEFNGNIPWCRIEDIEGNYFNGTKSNQYVSQETIDKMNLKIIPTGSVICSCSASLGTYAINTCPIITNQTFIGLVCSEKISNHFLLNLMNTQTRKLKIIAGGTTIPYISREKFEEYNIKIPSLPEQEKIASFLTLIDKKIEKQKELVELLKKYKRGLLSAIFSQKLRFKDDNGNNYPAWEEKRLENILKIKHGKSQKEIECNNGKYPILATGGEIGKTNSYLWDKPCVLIGRKGTIDKPQYMDTPFWTVDTLFYSEVFKENNAKYLYYLFNTINWKKYDESTGVPSLSAKTIERIKVTLSINYSEQLAISKILSKFDDKIQQEEFILEKLQNYKKGLLQQMFI